MVADTGGRVCGASHLRLSAGAAYFPDDGRDAEELLAIADARMYEMKREHHSRSVTTSGLDQLAEALASAPATPALRKQSL